MSGLDAEARRVLKLRVSERQKARLTRAHATETDAERATRHVAEATEVVSAEHVPLLRPRPTGDHMRWPLAWWRDDR